MKKIFLFSILLLTSTTALAADEVRISPEEYTQIRYTPHNNIVRSLNNADKENRINLVQGLKRLSKAQNRDLGDTNKIDYDNIDDLVSYFSTGLETLKEQKTPYHLINADALVKAEEDKYQQKKRAHAEKILNENAQKKAQEIAQKKLEEESKLPNMRRKFSRE